MNQRGEDRTTTEERGDTGLDPGKGATILIVDDEETNLLILESMLVSMSYRPIKARDGNRALEIVKSELPDIILLDLIMPIIDGFTVLQSLKSQEETKLIPVVIISSLEDLDSRVRALSLGADDFLTKPIEHAELNARVRSLLLVKAYYDYMKESQRTLEKEVEKKTRELRKAYETIKGASLDTIIRLTKAAEFRDPETGNHTNRVSRYAAAIAGRMNLGPDFVEMIRYAAPMHDLGKIGIPDQILQKPSKLESSEWDIMRKHSEMGSTILEGSEFEFIKVAQAIALTHHEKWDGTGYPQGLRGEEIPIEGRITAIADVFDALISRRPYKPPFSREEALTIIRELRGRHFDPQVVDAFLEIRDDIEKIINEFKD